MTSSPLVLVVEDEKDLADLVLIVPSAETARIQELHLAIEHVICDLVEDRLKG